MSYYIREFPGSLVVITPCFCCRGTGSVPGQVTKIPHAVQLSKKKKKKISKVRKQMAHSNTGMLEDFFPPPHSVTSCFSYLA